MMNIIQRRSKMEQDVFFPTRALAGHGLIRRRIQHTTQPQCGIANYIAAACCGLKAFQKMVYVIGLFMQ